MSLSRFLPVLAQANNSLLPAAKRLTGPFQSHLSDDAHYLP